MMCVRARTFAVDDVFEPSKLGEDELWQGHASVTRAGALELALVLGKALEELLCERGLERVALQQQPHERVLDAAVARVE